MYELFLLIFYATYVLNDHNEERQLNGESLLGVKRGVDVVGGNIGTHNFEDGRLDIRVSDSLNMSISDLLVPNLKRLGSIRKQNGVSLEFYRSINFYNLPDGVKDREETGLVGGLEHFNYFLIL